MKDLVSIVITTRNEEKNIENCLVSIREQTYDPIEIIVVDNFSSDRTKEIALRYTPSVYDRGPERSAQRNFGMIEKARGRYVMYVDADMLLSPSLIEGCVATLKQNPDGVALHIPEIILGSSFWSQVRRFERGFYNGTVIDGARFFVRETFIEVGGFDPHLSGPEDWDLDKKIKQKGRILFLSFPESSSEEAFVYRFVKERGIHHFPDFCCIFHNESEFHLGKYLSKKAYYTMSFQGYEDKWGKDDPDIRKQLGFFYRYFGVFVEHGKWRSLVRHPWLAMGMYVLRFLTGVVYLMRKRGGHHG